MTKQKLHSTISNTSSCIEQQYLKKGGIHLVNTRKIKGRIVEVGLTQRDLARVLELSQPTVSQKISNIRAMSVREAFIIADILRIPDSEFREYFFKEEIA